MRENVCVRFQKLVDFFVGEMFDSLHRLGQSQRFEFLGEFGDRRSFKKTSQRQFDAAQLSDLVDGLSGEQ